MAKCEVYKNFREKEKVFSSDSRKIFDYSEFELLKQKYIGSNNYIFRGINNASFKMYSSLHRYFIENGIDVYNEKLCSFIENLFYRLLDDNEIINYARLCFENYYNKELFDRYNKILMNKRMSEFIFSFHTFSLLQHYKCISPFLDFSENFHTALFFAIDEHTILTNKFIEPNNFISLYVVNKNSTIKPFDIQFQDDAKIYDLISNISPDLKNYIKQITKQISDYFLFNPEVNLIKQEPYIANPNIIAQNGCFLTYKHTTSNYPLEHFMKDEITCYDISKCLIPEIKKKTILPTKENLFPFDHKLTEIIEKAFIETSTLFI